MTECQKLAAYLKQKKIFFTINLQYFFIYIFINNIYNNANKKKVLDQYNKIYDLKFKLDNKKFFNFTIKVHNSICTQSWERWNLGFHN